MYNPFKMIKKGIKCQIESQDLQDLIKLSTANLKEGDNVLIAIAYTYVDGKMYRKLRELVKCCFEDVKSNDRDWGRMFVDGKYNIHIVLFGRDEEKQLEKYQHQLHGMEFKAVVSNQFSGPLYCAIKSCLR